MKYFDVLSFFHDILTYSTNNFSVVLLCSEYADKSMFCIFNVFQNRVTLRLQICVVLLRERMIHLLLTGPRDLPVMAKDSSMTTPQDTMMVRKIMPKTDVQYAV